MCPPTVQQYLISKGDFSILPQYTHPPSFMASQLGDDTWVDLGEDNLSVISFKSTDLESSAVPPSPNTGIVIVPYYATPAPNNPGPVVMISEMESVCPTKHPTKLPKPPALSSAPCPAQEPAASTIWRPDPVFLAIRRETFALHDTLYRGLSALERPACAPLPTPQAPPTGSELATGGGHVYLHEKLRAVWAAVWWTLNSDMVGDGKRLTWAEFVAIAPEDVRSIRPS
ncbi:hypothetical protein B0H67DRAFT_680664 [Lasiosphaeris hirsuta]|uniref:Uncharacterized protein n=1 Tax=Lasiosphaeris hirsuta TaxID=260670 RepID=A0AA40B059_9PEZI|nr:hypothetical protein B0H67DRAFT_680664 [Lasiosphaeris hirsuta]